MTYATWSDHNLVLLITSLYFHGYEPWIPTETTISPAYDTSEPRRDWEQLQAELAGHMIKPTPKVNDSLKKRHRPPTYVSQSYDKESSSDPPGKLSHTNQVGKCRPITLIRCIEPVPFHPLKYSVMMRTWFEPKKQIHSGSEYITSVLDLQW